MAQHLTDAEYAEIAQRYEAFILANHKASVEYAEWPLILGPDLFKRAVECAYFGAQGTIPGFPYGDLIVKGATVDGESGIEGAPGIKYTLRVNGVALAVKYGGGDFDTVAWAKSLGYDI